VQAGGSSGNTSLRKAAFDSNCSNNDSRAKLPVLLHSADLHVASGAADVASKTKELAASMAPVHSIASENFKRTPSSWKSAG